MAPLISATLKERFLGSKESAGYNTAIDTIQKEQYPQLKGTLIAIHNI
jgi:hypothetical protein